jgi:hypothetical protein
VITPPIEPTSTPATPKAGTANACLHLASTLPIDESQCLVTESALDKRMLECSFSFEMLARIVAIYLCVDCCRYLWHGLVERKIAYFIPSFLDWLIDGSNGVAIEMPRRSGTGYKSASR